MAQHRAGCPLDRRMDSGFGDECQPFITKYRIVIQFDIHCLGCCFDYLTRDRNYTRVDGAFDRVQFTDGNSASVSCFVKVPGGGGKRGQLSTLKDLNLGIPTVRPFDTSRTYQLYSPTAGLSMGIQVQARMESVAIEEATLGELTSIYVNYADGALMELYRSSMNLSSLRGVCKLVRERRPTEPLTLNMAGLSLS